MDNWFALLGIVIFTIPIALYVIFRFAVRYSDTETQKCKKCRQKMIDSGHFLFLIPVRFDQKYKASPEYYKKNFVQIKTVGEIPEGQRACHMYLFTCTNCGYKNISIVDFLKVRDAEVIKGGEIYEYADFSEYLQYSVEYGTTDYEPPTRTLLG